MKNLLYSLFILLLLTIHSFAQTQVEFTLEGFPENFFEEVSIRGSEAPLSWERSTPLNKRDGSYFISIEFPKEVTKLEYKFVYSSKGANTTWETIENRFLLFRENKKLRERSIWNVEQIVDISNLPLIQPNELREDYKLIEQMILEVHPGTFRYNNKESIENGLVELKNKFQYPLTYGEAYLAMSKLTSLLKCDHTKVGFNNQSRTINSVIHGQSDKVPFTFRWLEKKMIVVYDATEGEHLEKGDEIISINGIHVSEIHDLMINYIAADGGTDKNRIRKMEVDGYDFRYNAFDVFYPLLFPISDGRLTLKVQKNEEMAVQEMSIATVSKNERTKRLFTRYQDFPRTRDDLWSFTITKDNIGILEGNSFGLMGWKALSLDYKAFLSDVFESLEMNRVENLIIDIRENIGGNDEMSTELFSYLDIKESITKEMYREGRTRYLTFPEPLKSNVQTWGDNPWYFNLEEEEKNGDYYVFRKNTSENTFNKKKENVFKGEVYLLTSSNNTSLAYYTALNFKKQNLGTIIGQETGGNLKGINGGQILFLRLPNSGIEIDFPIMGGFVYGNQRDQGVQPDIETYPSLEQIIKGEDVELKTALRLIRNEE